jgi:hypothetical protein
MDCKEGHLLLHNHASTALTEERKEEKSIKKWNMHMILNLMQLYILIWMVLQWGDITFLKYGDVLVGVYKPH